MTTVTEMDRSRQNWWLFLESSGLLERREGRAPMGANPYRHGFGRRTDDALEPETKGMADLKGRAGIKPPPGGVPILTWIPA